MTGTDVVLDGVGLVLRAALAHAEQDRGTGLVVREPFVFDTIKNMYFVKYYVLASVTLLYFDHAVTLPLEIRRIWCTRFTGASLIFLLNRYIPFFGYIPVLVGIFNPPWNINVSPCRCKKFAPFVGTLTAISNLISAVILILRTYALYNRAIWVLLVTGVVGAASVAISAWSTSTVEGELFSFPPVSVCVPMLRHETGLRFAWITTFCFDFLVFGLTIARTYRFMKAQSRLHSQSGLTMLLIRDGSIYFLVMSIMNAVNYILSVRIQNSFFASATGTNSILANAISVTMVSRLLLNLREEAIHYSRRSSGSARASTAQSLTDTNLIFTSRILGNLTAELDYDEERPRGFRSRIGSENYYVYDYSGEESDGLYELQSRTARSGTTSHSGYSGRAISTDPGSSLGTGTVASSSGSGSGSGSGSDSAKRKRGYSGRAWTASLDTALSTTAPRHPRGEPQTPAVELESHSNCLPSRERTPHTYPPRSPGTADLSPTSTRGQASSRVFSPQFSVSRGISRGTTDSG